MVVPSNLFRDLSKSLRRSVLLPRESEACHCRPGALLECPRWPSYANVGRVALSWPLTPCSSLNGGQAIGISKLALRPSSSHSWLRWSGAESISLFPVDPQREGSGVVAAHFRDQCMHRCRHFFECRNRAAISRQGTRLAPLRRRKPAKRS